MCEGGAGLFGPGERSSTSKGYTRKGNASKYLQGKRPKKRVLTAQKCGGQKKKVFMRQSGQIREKEPIDKE